MGEGHPPHSVRKDEEWWRNSLALLLTPSQAQNLSCTGQDLVTLGWRHCRDRTVEKEG